MKFTLLAILLSSFAMAQVTPRVSALQVWGYSDQYTNASSGTTLYNLAKIVSNQAVTTTISDTGIPVYIVALNAGTSGIASLAKGGQFSCQMDSVGATTGHFIGQSTLTGGRCADLGVTVPSGRWVIGIAVSSVSGNANAQIDLIQGFVAPPGLLSGTLSAIPATCVVGAALYQATDQPSTLQMYACNATNIWSPVGYARGASNPATCSTGQIFFNTSASAGSNIYLCTSTNTWTQVTGGGGGASSASQLGDFLATTTSSVQTIGASCSSTTPCNIRVGNAVLSVTAPITLTLGSGTLSDTIYWYATASGVFAGYSSANSYTCSGCTAAASTIAFPDPSIAGAVPLWLTTVASGTPATFSAITEAMDKRSVYSSISIAQGSGIGIVNNPSTGVDTISTDPNQVPRYFTGSGAPAGSCTTGRDFYTNTSGGQLYNCVSSAWQAAGGGSQTVVNYFPSGSYYGSGSALAFLVNGSWAGGTSHYSVSLPNSISSIQTALLMAATDYYWFSYGFSSTWSGSAGTVDVALDMGNWAGTPSAGNWNFNVYLGCVATGGGVDYTYGTASATTAAPPPGTADTNYQRYLANAVNIPASCTAGRPARIVVQRVADTGGTTGIAANSIGTQVTVRGN